MLRIIVHRIFLCITPVGGQRARCIRGEGEHIVRMPRILGRRLILLITHVGGQRVCCISTRDEEGSLLRNNFESSDRSARPGTLVGRGGEVFAGEEKDEGADGDEIR